MPSQNKEVIYVDVDDEITAIIDKVRSSSSKIVALVLPKRSTVMQSVVNMKLLKRTAGEAKKSIVLITSEAALLPLAGIAGLHVAKTLQTKPEIPAAPAVSDAPVSLDENEAEEAPLDTQRPVGELAGMPSNEEDTIEVDNDEEEEAAPVAAAAAAKKPGFNKKLKVPNFNSMRNRLIIGVTALLLLIFGWVMAFHIMPRATITIRTDNVNVNSDLNLTASVDAKSLDEKQMIVPAEIKQSKKTDSQKVPATGKKDVGTKAGGEVTFSTQTNCMSQVQNVPAGTTVSAGGLNFITQDVGAFAPSGFQNGKCVFTTGAVDVTAQNAGDQYNLSPRAYAVAGRSDVSASGSAMSGGTSKVLTIVSQQDIDGAKQKILESMSASVKQDLSNQLKNGGFIALTDTLSSGDPLVTASPNADTEANEVTVTVVVTFSMTGAKKNDVQKLLENDIKKKIDTSKQKILSNGLDKAVIRVTDNNGKQPKFSMQSVALAGVQQDAEAIKKAVVGKKKGQVQEIILARPGVKEVNVDYSPMWVYTTPKSTGKLTIVFQQSNGTTSTEQ